MRLATVSQARDIETYSVKVYGMTSEVLMESAGALCAREIQQNFYPELTRGMTAVVCGPGNNGGDGLVVARHLHSAGFRDLTVYIFAPNKKRSELFKTQLKRAELHGIRVIDAIKDKRKLQSLASAKLIVDALFGIGLHGPLKESSLEIVDKLNSIKVPIVSLDAPSGLNCDSGVVEGACVRAHTTMTFGLAKPGFFVGEGPQHVGKLRVLSIGFPYESLRGIATTHFLFNDKLARRYLPARKDQSNKGDHGRLVVIAGCPGYWGAGILAAQAAYRMGAGYVTWASYTMPIEKLEQTPEVMTTSIDNEVIWSKKINAYAVGPGLGTGDETLQILRRLKNLKAEKVVVDADAITVAAKHKLFPFPSTWVLTPHAAELARIIKADKREVESDRFHAALEASKIAGCHVLLKGYRTIISYEKRCMIINSGNSALAKAGAGDVLTGMIGSLMAQGLETLQATATAAYIHGRIADEWVRMGMDRRALNAGDLKEHMASILSRVSQGAIF